MKDPLCNPGCYMFADGPERTACENACRMARRAGHVDPHALKSGTLIRRLLAFDPHERTAFQCAARGCDGCSVCEPAALPLTDRIHE